LYIVQDKHLVTLVSQQGQTRFGFRGDVVNVIARQLNELTVNVTVSLNV